MTARRIRPLLLALLSSVIPCGAAQADTPKQRSPGMHSEFLEELAKKVELSETQRQEIVEIKRAFQKKHEETMRNLRRDVLAVRGTMELARKNHDRAALQKSRAKAKKLRQDGERLRAEFEAEMLTVLTDEQRQLYTRMKAEKSRGQRGK